MQSLGENVPEHGAKYDKHRHKSLEEGLAFAKTCCTDNQPEDANLAPANVLQDGT